MIDAAGRWFAEWKAQPFKKKNEIKISKKKSSDACVLCILLQSQESEKGVTKNLRYWHLFFCQKVTVVLQLQHTSMYSHTQQIGI